jgi:hypothetical protein
MLDICSITLGIPCILSYYLGNLRVTNEQGRPLHDIIQLQTRDDNAARSAPRDGIRADDEAEVPYEGVDRDEGEGPHTFTESEIDDGTLEATTGEEDALMILD